MKWFQSSKIGLALVGTLIFAALASAAEDTWTQKADMPTARNLLSTCELNGKIYAIGGATGPDTSLSAVEEYDPATDIWARRASFPEAICGLSTSAVDGKIYAIGGAPSPVGEARSSVYVYDPSTDTWMRKADMPAPRRFLSASVVNGKIYAIGGQSLSKTTVSLVEEYDPATDTWTRKADMPTVRGAHSAGVVDGKIYAIGGMVGGTSPYTGLSVVEAYDPATDTWTRKADMPTRRVLHSVSAVDGKIYSIGGVSVSNTIVSTVEEYDPATDTWTTKTPMPTALWGLSTSAVGGKIYAVGGARTVMAGSSVSTVQEYDTGLTILPPEPWSLGGAWISTCLGTDGAVIVAYETLIPVDSTGDVLAYRLSFVNADPTVSGLLPESDRAGEMLGTTVRTGPNIYDFTILAHATKSRPGRRPEILGIVVFSGKMTLTGKDTRLDTMFASLYGPDADVNPADGLPDENAKPLLCVGPMEGAARRFGLMPPCTPTPRP